MVATTPSRAERIADLALMLGVAVLSLLLLPFAAAGEAYCLATDPHNRRRARR